MNEELLLGEDLTQEEISGLGAVTTVNNALVKKVGQIKAKAARAAVANASLDPKQKLLLARVGQLPPAERERIRAGKMSLKPKNYYARKRYGALNNGEMLTANDDIVVGGINIGKQKIEAGTVFQVNRIKFGYASSTVTSGTFDEPNTRIYTNSIDASLTGGTNAVPACFANGKIVLRKAGAIVAEFEVSDMLRDTLSVGVGVNGKFDGYELPNPLLLTDTDQIGIQFVPAEGVTIPTSASHYLEVRLIGDELSARGN